MRYSKRIQKSPSDRNHEIRSGNFHPFLPSRDPLNLLCDTHTFFVSVVRCDCLHNCVGCYSRASTLWVVHPLQRIHGSVDLPHRRARILESQLVHRHVQVQRWPNCIQRLHRGTGRAISKELSDSVDDYTQLLQAVHSLGRFVITVMYTLDLIYLIIIFYCSS